jgi:hypothetical protein
MHQAQPKGAATRADTTTVRSSSWPIHWVRTLLSTSFAANLNPKGIQARLGHATITETMDTHEHLFPDAEELGRGAIDAILAVALTEQGRYQDPR